MEDTDYDLVVIGAGGGGFAAAIEASRLGGRVAIVEGGTLGGTCTNTGCIPSKALLAAAAARHAALDVGRYPGIAAAAGPVDMAQLISGKQALVDQMRATKYEDLIDAYGWDLYRGLAAFGGAAEEPVLEIAAAEGGTEVLRARHYLVATGSAPALPDVPGIAETGFLTSTTAMELDAVPASMTVIGGGYVALEMAQLFARLGTAVTILARSRLVSHEEPEASRALEDALAEEGIVTARRALPRNVARAADGKVIVTADVAGRRREFRAAELLIATGRRPATDGLGLERVGVALGRGGGIVADRRQATSNPRIWAAGDVTGGPEFVYVAAAQGALAAENALSGADRALGSHSLPRVVFTSPALGVAGLTEAQAHAEGLACECRVLPLALVPRAIVDRDTRGFIKVVAKRGTGRILGVTAVARDAGEIAASAVHLIETGTTVAELGRRWAPYLTMAEGLRIAAQSFTEDVAMLSCCAA
ncbi:mercuric reductase MerA [Sinomonas cyclohexanicum]|uniref:Mercuric reductase MerA n=1 Tax=Sinomonas cyclohexanicum TaxID=322009 RepID=A0ABM7PV98_SINCY|nr:mercury(II) reductase [Corynebacterium cyclohexanicum]BCT76179.1 mercuric reductase MerA [Corynebacterium cyclohexanicum]